MRHLRLIYKLAILGAIMALAIIYVGAFGVSQVNTALVEQKKREIQARSQQARAIVDALAARTGPETPEADRLTPAQAQRTALTVLAGLSSRSASRFLVIQVEEARAGAQDPQAAAGAAAGTGDTRRFRWRLNQLLDDPDALPDEDARLFRDRANTALALQWELRARLDQRGGAFFDHVEPGLGDLADARPMISHAVLVPVWEWVVVNTTLVEDIEQLSGVFAGHVTLAGFVALLVVAIVSLLVARQIVNPVVDMTEQLHRLAEGDVDVHVSGTDRGDEIGTLARALTVFRDNRLEADRLTRQNEQAQAAQVERGQRIEALTREFEARVGEVLESTAGAVGGLVSTSEELAHTAEETRRRAEEVAEVARQASLNVQTVAAAAEELGASIGEISRQVQGQNAIALTAAETAGQSSARIMDLAEAAQRIGEVVTLIRKIAHATNMLALNATIEAARAGASGKGFAVVAMEVKNLARGTSEATDDVGRQVAAVQSSTDTAVEAIADIDARIGEMKDIARRVAEAVQQQHEATREIAENVNQAAGATDRVSTTILGVRQAADRTTGASASLLAATESLTRQAEALRSCISAFLTAVKAS